MVSILNNLYLGSYDESENNHQNYDIILNCALECECSSPKKTLKYYIKDITTQQISEYFDIIADVIHNNINENKILVHCYSGKSRSSSFILAYLIKYCDMSLQRAFDFVRQKREILPNIYFMMQLSEYEKKITSRSSLNIDNYTIICISETFNIEKNKVANLYNKYKNYDDTIDAIFPFE